MHQTFAVFSLYSIYCLHDRLWWITLSLFLSFYICQSASYNFSSSSMTSFPLRPQKNTMIFPSFAKIKRIKHAKKYLEEFQLAFSTKHAKISLKFLSFHCCLFIFISRVLFKTKIENEMFLWACRVSYENSNLNNKPQNNKSREGFLWFLSCDQ